jgi:starvation-inducible outer membrane lipoprotein
MRAHLAIAIALSATLTACTPFPELESTIPDDLKDAPYPDLVPLDTLNAAMAQPQLTDESLSGLESRADRLRARAARLGGTVIDAPTRQRMSTGVQ